MLLMKKDAYNSSFILLQVSFVKVYPPHTVKRKDKQERLKQEKKLYSFINLLYITYSKWTEMENLKKNALINATPSPQNLWQ